LEAAATIFKEVINIGSSRSGELRTQSMNKIMILVNDNGTIYYFRLELLKRLIAENHEVVISVPSSERNREFENIGCKIEIIDICRDGINPFKELLLLRTYYKQIKRIKPDLVLTYTAKPNIYGSLACQRLKIPYINNVTGLGSMFQNDNLIKGIMLFLQKQAYKKSHCVFFQNAANRQYLLKKKVISTKTALLPGSGVNLEKCKYQPYPEDESRVRFALVSRVRQDKGFDELFEAVKVISSKTDRAEFHLAGWYEDNNYKDKISEMVKNYPFIYHGSLDQDEVYDLISKCHCLIHPSHHEGMANSLLEAAAIGRPCLASNIPGCKEVIDDGMSGFLFKVKNIESLAKTIEKFIAIKHEDKIKMGLQGRKIIEAKFDRNIVINKYMHEINTALSPKRI